MTAPVTHLKILRINVVIDLKATANAWFRTLKFFDQAKELKSPVS
jgi:hypothetical protein